MVKKIMSALLFIMFCLSGTAFAGGFTFESKEYGFTITLPENWEISKDRKARNILVIAKAPGGESINVAVEKVNKEYAKYTFEDFSPQELRDYVKELTSNLQSANPGVVLHDWGTKTIDEKKAVWFLLTVPVHNVKSSFDMKTLHVQILYNAKLYMITCGAIAEKYPGFRKTFESTVNSLKFNMIGINL